MLREKNVAKGAAWKSTQDAGTRKFNDAARKISACTQEERQLIAAKQHDVHFRVGLLYYEHVVSFISALVASL